MMADWNTWRMIFAGRIHPVGWFWIRWACFLSFVFFFVSFFLCGIFVLSTLFMVFFFRDPDRVSAHIPSSVVSPADGLIVDISDQIPPSELSLPDGDYHKISIFLNLWDVHVNRIPISGQISQRFYISGGCACAANKEASSLNERLGIVIRGENFSVGCVQVAGFVARRILCDANQDDQVQQGQRYGIILFGSRLDCYVPKSLPLLIERGQRMIAGETIMAKAD